MPARPEDQSEPLGRTYGLPPERLQRAWRIEDIAEFLGIGLTKARALMKQPEAPTRLRTGSLRCDRWNAVEVLDWLHGDSESIAASPTDYGSVPATGAPATPSSSLRATDGALTRPRQRRAA